MAWRRLPEQAVRIAAAAARFSEEEGVAIDYAKGTSAPRYLEEARAAVNPAELARLEAEGGKLTVREAVRLALHRADGGSVVVAGG